MVKFDQIADIMLGWNTYGEKIMDILCMLYFPKIM